MSPFRDTKTAARNSSSLDTPSLWSFTPDLALCLRGVFQNCHLARSLWIYKAELSGSIYGQGIVFWFLFIAFPTREGLYHAFMQETEAAYNLSYIQFISWQIRIFPPDYLKGESQRKTLSQSLGLLLIFLTPGQVGPDILWGLAQLKTRQHGKLQLETIPLKLHITK